MNGEMRIGEPDVGVRDNGERGGDGAGFHTTEGDGLSARDAPIPDPLVGVVGVIGPETRGGDDLNGEGVIGKGKGALLVIGVPGGWIRA